jgi:hypothetical protein
MTETELDVMAALAIIGLSNNLKSGYYSPPSSRIDNVALHGWY